MKSELKPHKVAIVLDPQFSTGLLHELAEKMHVWLISSEANLQSAEQYYAENESTADDLLVGGISGFVAEEHSLSMAELAEILDLVDLHHNEFAHSPEWGEAHVFGVQLTNTIEAIFEDFGFSGFEVRSRAFFIARRDF